MSNENLSRQDGKTKKSGKWYIRLTALVLAVVMIVSIAMNRSVSPDLAQMKAANFHEQGEDIVMDTGSIQEKMEALKEVKEIEKRLNEDYSEAMACIEKGQYKEAIKPIRELLDNIDDVSVAAYLRATLAELYYTIGDYLNCALTCKNIINDGNDTDGTYQFMRGVSLFQTGDAEACIGELEAAIEAGYPDTGICKAQIALAAVNAGDFEKAVKAGTEALDKEHDASLDQTLYYVRAIAELQLQDFENAIKDLDTLLKEDESNTEYLYNRGVAYMAQEKYGQAAADFRKAMDRKMDEIGCLYNYGICAIMSEDYENGIEALERVVERDENKEFTKGAKELLKQIEAAIQEAVEEEA